MATMTPTTGYKTLQNGVAPYESGYNIFTNIWDAQSQVVGIMKFTTSIASTLGLPSDVKWSDIDITKAILTLTTYRNNSKSSGYYISVSGKALTSSSSQTTATITNVSHYTSGNAFASGSTGSGQVITFDLKTLFNGIPDSNSSTPSSNTWYIYIWHSTYTAGSASADSYGFTKNSASLEIEGTKKGNVGYYNGTEWVKCEASFWDGVDWAPLKS